MPGSDGSGRTALEARAATLPGVSAPSSVVRSVMRTASSRAKTLDSRLIERFASVPARSSIATWSIEPILGSRGSSGSSNPVGSAGACAITVSVSPSLGPAVPRDQDVRDLVQVFAGLHANGPDPGGVGAAHIPRGISHCDRSIERPVTCALSGDPDQLAALLGVAAERALPPGKEPVETQARHPGAGHRFRVAGQQSETDAHLCELGERSLRMWGDLPVVGARVSKQVDVALREESAPRAELPVDGVVSKSRGAEHLAGDAQAGLASVVDALDGVRGRIDVIELAQCWQERVAGERIVRQEQRAVDVKQRQERRHSPRRSSIASSRRHLGRDFTFSSRTTGWPSTSSISGRARVPICFTTEPPLPITICFCDSVSTKIVARTTLSVTSSTSTEIAWGTSSRVSWSDFSRTSSAIWSSGSRSVRCSRG